MPNTLQQIQETLENVDSARDALESALVIMRRALHRHTAEFNAVTAPTPPPADREVAAVLKSLEGRTWVISDGSYTLDGKRCADLIRKLAAHARTRHPAEGITATVLCTEFVAAFVADEKQGCGRPDIIGGHFGPNTTAWFRSVAADFVDSMATPAPDPKPDPGTPARLRALGGAIDRLAYYVRDNPTRMDDIATIRRLIADPRITIAEKSQPQLFNNVMNFGGAPKPAMSIDEMFVYHPDHHAPGPAVTVRYDLSPAEKEGAIRDRLISLGWTPPEDPLGAYRARLAQAEMVETLREARTVWLQENPGEDGADQVTPFDRFLYTDESAPKAAPAATGPGPWQGHKPA